MADECFCSFSELSKKMSKSMGDEGEMEKLQKEAEALEKSVKKWWRLLKVNMEAMMSLKIAMLLKSFGKH